MFDKFSRLCFCLFFFVQDDKIYKIIEALFLKYLQNFLKNKKADKIFRGFRDSLDQRIFF